MDKIEKALEACEKVIDGVEDNTITTESALLLCTKIARLTNDEENMIRTCFGLKEFASQTDEDTEGKSISNIDYTDLVGYENWKKNAE